MNKPLAYIIDLDGTLYDNSHRQHLIPADRSNTAGWVEFNCACTDDVLREDMSDLVRSILCSGREVIFLTGRGTAAREQTMQRLLKDFNFIDKPPLIMRPMDWHTSAAEFKGDAIQRILDAKGWSASQLIALEDDPSVVMVMRGMGVTVLHIDSKCCTVEKPHHNGMMQLSNELADAKAALRRLAAYARAHAGDIECTGDHPIAVADKLAGRDDVLFYGCSATDKAPAKPFGKVKLYGNTEQLDTAPAQFESLAGEPVKTKDDGGRYEQDDSPECGWVVTHSGKDYFYREQKDAVTHMNAALESGRGVSLRSLISEPVSEPHKLNDPVILDSYEIERFGIFSATECESGLLLQIEQFLFGTENCPQVGKENMVPKFALQAIINRLQAHCNSMGEDTLIDIFASSAAPRQEVKP